MRRQGIQERTDWEAVGTVTKCVLVVLFTSWDAFAEGNDTAATRAAAEGIGERKRQVIVSIPDRKLVLVEDGRIVRVYPVAVGASVTPSPAGSFQVINRVIDPTYYHAGKVVPPGSSNPLGNRWLGLSKKGYGIH